MLCEPLMQSMCSLRHQCHSHGSLPHPVHHCTTCAPEARCVVSALAEGIKMPARAPDAPPVRRCPACARHSARTPKTLCVANTLAERIKMPARAPDAGSCTHSHFHMRVRAAIPTPICGFAQPIPTHTCKPARAAFSTPGFPAAPLPIPGFPAEMTVIGQEYDGKPGIHRGSAQAPHAQKSSTTCED